MRVPVGKTQFATVDSADYERVSRVAWSYNGNGYARGRVQINGRSKKVYMHRYILDAPDDLHVDHVNGNGLDNRRCNLRLATRSENLRNRGADLNSNTPYKGVHYRRDRNVYQAYINVEGKRSRLGNFRDAESAARAYDKAARELHGEFAKLNFPTNQPTKESNP